MAMKLRLVVCLRIFVPQGWPAPVLDLLDPRDPAVRDWVLADGPLGDYLDPDRVRALLDKDVLPNSESKMLFNIVSTKMFLEGRS
jgi:asparagine synthase (glutamine-hydrolysing)